MLQTTLEAVRAADRQQAALRAQLGPEAEAALQAAEVAFAEGEITLLEWLDAVRAYQEAEAAFADVLAESYTQRAALERLLAVPLIQ
jgi:outer membrane protein TolC